MPTIKVKNSQSEGKSYSEIYLPAIVDLPAAAELRQALLAALSDAAPCVLLDASEVERISTSAIQIILGAEKEIKLKGGSLGFNKISASLIQIWQDLGLADQLTSLHSHKE